ncbi:hypothetical protein GCM10020218_036090 [Dactylosporangium vinaceum]
MALGKQIICPGLPIRRGDGCIARRRDGLCCFGRAHECPGPNGEPHLYSYDLRRSLSAATTVCTIACTVLTGALMSGHTTHAAPAHGSGSAAIAAEAIPDRLLELRSATRSIPQPPAPPPPVAAAPPPAPAAAPPRAARAESSTRASRSATRSQRSVRPQTARPPTRRPARTRTGSTGGPATTVYSGNSGGVVGFAMAQVGKGYSFGSTGPDRYDCSGLVVAAFRRLGISLPRSTGGLAGMGRPVSRGELQPGDLVFPSSGHVGIYIGGGRIVHASTERDGVKISPIYAFRFARRVVG